MGRGVSWSGQALRTTLSLPPAVSRDTGAVDVLGCFAWPGVRQRGATACGTFLGGSWRVLVRTGVAYDPRRYFRPECYGCSDCGVVEVQTFVIAG